LPVEYQKTRIAVHAEAVAPALAVGRAKAAMPPVLSTRAEPGQCALIEA